MEESRKNSDSIELDGTNVLSPLILGLTAWLVVPLERRLLSTQLAVLGYSPPAAADHIDEGGMNYWTELKRALNPPPKLLK